MPRIPLFTKIPGEYFDEFFDPLVGTPKAREELKAFLTDHITDPSSPEAYGELQDAGAHALHWSAEPYITETKGTERGIWRSINSNGVFGIDMTVAGLQAVGDICANQAQVPQQERNVRKNADRITRHIFGMAFSGFVTGSINLEAMRHGYNPRNHLLVPFILARQVCNFANKIDFHKALVISPESPANQLEIKPRYARRTSRYSKRRCPATGAYIDIDDNKKESALLLYMRTVTDVAVETIYPHHFGIEPSEQ